MRTPSSRIIIGLILGWVLTFEGFFALSVADSATIAGFGGIKGTTFTTAAVQLVLLGVIISISWAFQSCKFGIHLSLPPKVMTATVYLTMLLVTMEGLVVVLLAGDVTVAGWGTVGKEYIALVGAQMCALGLLSLRNWRLRETPPTNWAVDLLGSLAAVLLVLEGLTAMGIAGRTVIEDFGGIGGGTFYLAGIQLLLLGLLLFIMWTLPPRLSFSRLGRLLSDRWSWVIVMTLGTLAALEALVASTLAGRMVIADIGSISKIYVVVGCSQLFVLGLAAPLLWKLRNASLDRRALLDLLNVTAMTVLAFEGVFAIGLAAQTHIDGLGIIRERTFLLAGAQLLVLSLLGLSAFFVQGNLLLGRLGNRAFSSLPVAVLTLIGLEGLAVTLLASNMNISDFGGIRERYVLLGGVQMVLLSTTALLLWVRSRRIPPRCMKVAISAAIFLVLMIPIAILL
ncbi:MAG: hypothetical protein JXA45_04350 [Methanomassiliicoccales archaeon]|nr:hypothetical protein [Methanomassiliicoccales archaeon]